MKTATFYVEEKSTKWSDENGMEFIPTPEQKLLHSIFGYFTKTEIVTEKEIFTIKYNRVPEMNTLWLEKSREFGYSPSDVLLKK